MSEPIKIALVALMGLPASGKSTLCNEIVRQTRSNIDGDSNKTDVIVLAYDDFVPLEIQALSSTDSGRELSAKELRGKFLQVIQIVVENLIESKGFVNLEEEVKTLFANIHNGGEATKPNLDFHNWKSALQVQTLDYATCKNLILLIDDNNYYHSMRNELYQIARKCKTGFCTLFTKASVQECLERNSGRGDGVRVANEVIEEMCKKLEEPDLLLNPCDALAFQINDVTDVNSYPLIQSAIEYALQNPLEVVQIPDRQEEIEMQRKICSENEIHQADQILRKWVHTEITLASFGTGRKEKKKYAEELSFRKAFVLKGLKSGALTVAALVTDPIAFRKEIISLAKEVDISTETP